MLACHLDAPSKATRMLQESLDRWFTGSTWISPSIYTKRQDLNRTKAREATIKLWNAALSEIKTPFDDPLWTEEWERRDQFMVARFRANRTWGEYGKTSAFHVKPAAALSVHA